MKQLMNVYVMFCVCTLPIIYPGSWHSLSTCFHICLINSLCKLWMNLQSITFQFRINEFNIKLWGLWLSTSTEGNHCIVKQSEATSKQEQAKDSSYPSLQVHFFYIYCLSVVDLKLNCYLLGNKVTVKVKAFSVLIMNVVFLSETN